MEESKSIREFRRAIRKLPRDEERLYKGNHFRTQKDHWLGWLFWYHTPGYYNRKSSKKRDAIFAYNHAVNPALLLYLINAIPLSDELIQAAQEAFENAGETMMAKSGAIRKAVPWSEIYKGIWGE